MQKNQQTGLSFLQTLESCCRELSGVNYRLIVLGRDLQAIQDYLTTGVRLMRPPISDNDVRQILSASLGARSDCEPQLSPSEIDQLADRAGGLPIWAKTVVGFLRQGKGLVEGRLSAILNSADLDTANALHRLYEEVFATACAALHPKEKAAVQLFLGVTLLSRGTFSLNYIANHGGQSLNTLNKRLIGDLAPILQVSNDRYSFAHLSIVEFLDDRDRQARLGIPVAKAFTVVALLTLQGYINALKNYAKRLDEVLSQQRQARGHTQSLHGVADRLPRRPDTTHDDRKMQQDFLCSLTGLKLHLINAVGPDGERAVNAKMNELVMDDAAFFLCAKHPAFLLRWEIAETEEYIGSLRSIVRCFEELAELVKPHI